jgi:hypothetical protein
VKQNQAQVEQRNETIVSLQQRTRQYEKRIQSFESQLSQEKHREQSLLQPKLQKRILMLETEKRELQLKKEALELALSDSELECGICMDRRRDTLVLPCAHLLYCRECLSKVESCPTCRTPISEIILCKL